MTQYELVIWNTSETGTTFGHVLRFPQLQDVIFYLWSFAKGAKVFLDRDCTLLEVRDFLNADSSLTALHGSLRVIDITNAEEF